MRYLTAIVVLAAVAALNSCGDSTPTSVDTAPDLKRAGAAPTLITGLDFIPWGISANGVVVGFRGTYESPQAIRWTRAGGAVELGDGFATAVNNAGYVVGYRELGEYGSPTNPRTNELVLWTPSGEEIGLGALPSVPSNNCSDCQPPLAIPVDLNERNEIVGYVFNLGPEATGFRWTQATGIVLLWTEIAQDPPSSIDVLGYVAGTNKFGDIVFACPPGGPYQVCLNRAKKHFYLGNPINGSAEPPEDGPYGNAIPSDLNDSREIVGSAGYYTTGGEIHPFIWSKTRGWRDLGTLGGDGSANAINNLSQVVGETLDGPDFETSTYHAFFWTERGGMVDLGAGRAWGISDAGEVIGTFSTASTAFTARSGRIDGEDCLRDPVVRASKVTYMRCVIGQ